MAQKFENVKKKLGFGCMRLPMLQNGEVDKEQFTRIRDLLVDVAKEFEK